MQLSELVKLQAEARAAMERIGGVPRTPREQDADLAVMHRFEDAARAFDFSGLAAALNAGEELARENERLRQALARHVITPASYCGAEPRVESYACIECGGRGRSSLTVAHEPRCVLFFAAKAGRAANASKELAHD